MATWPVNWQQRVMARCGIPDNRDTYAILSAWQRSTPLPADSNNPFGMPSGSNGAKPYLGTPYAIFPSFGLFAKAFATFIKSYQGSKIEAALRSDSPYSATWDVVHALGWPATQTETDYPASLLDITPQSFRESVITAAAEDRKTSGIITIPSATETSITSQVASVNRATHATVKARSVIGSIMRGYNGNG